LLKFSGIYKFLPQKKLEKNNSRARTAPRSFSFEPLFPYPLILCIASFHRFFFSIDPVSHKYFYIAFLVFIVYQVRKSSEQNGYAF